MSKHQKDRRVSRASDERTGERVQRTTDETDVGAASVSAQGENYVVGPYVHSGDRGPIITTIPAIARFDHYLANRFVTAVNTTEGYQLQTWLWERPVTIPLPVKVPYPPILSPGKIHLVGTSEKEDSSDGGQSTHACSAMLVDVDKTWGGWSIDPEITDNFDAVTMKLVAEKKYNFTGQGRLVTWAEQSTNIPERIGDSGTKAADMDRHYDIAPIQFGKRGGLITIGLEGLFTLVTWTKHHDPKRLADSGEQAGSLYWNSDFGMGKLAVVQHGIWHKKKYTRKQHAEAVTAVRTKSGRLKLILWEFAYDGKKITRLGDIYGTTMDGDPSTNTLDIALVDGQGSPIVVTTIIDADGRLRLDTWKRVADDYVEGSNSVGMAGEAKQVVAATLSDTNRIVTLVKTLDDNAKAILWEIGKTGSITRIGSGATFGPVENLGSLMPIPGSNVQTAMAPVQMKGSNRLRIYGLGVGMAVSEDDDKHIGQFEQLG